MDLNQGLVGLLCSCQAVLVLQGKAGRPSVQQEPWGSHPTHFSCVARAGCAPICHATATHHSPTLSRPYLVGSKLYSRFPFHQRCTDLHDHRLDGVGATPALRNETHGEARPTQRLCFQCNQRAFPSSARQWYGRSCQEYGVW